MGYAVRVDGAHLDAAAGELLDLFRSTIVVRGSDPMAPRELLPLSLPQSAPEPAAGDTAADRDDTLNPFERGPEITEVR